MKQSTIKRSRKKLTAEEARQYDDLLEQVEKDRPELEAWAKAGFVRDERLRRIVQTLKAARRKQGISLAELDERTGIGKGNLSKLENDPQANPTLATLLRYADAIGVSVRVSIVPAKAKRSAG
jgi:DNA-binding Xre family transcriptional regulator